MIYSIIHNMLNIRKIFSEVCDDCISIILDYIDTPHDILKLIYYNKYHLYCVSDNNNLINTTTDSVQLLLYRKFYKKVMLNMSLYAQKYEVQWKDIKKLLSDTTIISGGSLLQSIYGDISPITNIDICFYYIEYLNIYGFMENTQKLLKLSEYISSSTLETTTITDIDIFTITNKKIFGAHNILKYDIDKDQYSDNKVEIFHMCNGRTTIIFNIHTKLEKNIAKFNKLSDLKTESTSMSSYKILNTVYNRDTDIYVKINIENETRFFYIPKDESFLNIYLDSQNILRYLSESDNCDKFRIADNIMENFENLHIVTSNRNMNIQKYLLKKEEPLLTSINNKFGVHKSHANYTSYDSLEKKYDICLNSLYDPYRQIGKDVMIDIENEEYYNSITFSSENNEKKLVPLTYNANDLLLNLVYLNSDRYGSPHDFINHDFDINICKQSFNGEKITLHAMKNLVHKKFEYNIGHIINNEMVCKDRKDKKYVCFRKRLQKYKARGFECVNELYAINKVKELLNIKNDPIDIETLKNIANELNIYEEDISDLHNYLNKL